MKKSFSVLIRTFSFVLVCFLFSTQVYSQNTHAIEKTSFTKTGWFGFLPQVAQGFDNLNVGCMLKGNPCLIPRGYQTGIVLEDTG